MREQRGRSEIAVDRDDESRQLQRPRVACVGFGFVGYKSALEFCRSNYDVTGVDTDADLVDAVENGEPPVEKSELEAYIREDTCRLSTRISDAADCSAYLVSVPTPLQADSETPDLAFVRAACRDVATVLDEGDLVVIQSTIYPGCTRDELIPELERSGLDVGPGFGVSHVPERYSPGNDDSRAVSRVVGSIDEEWQQVTVEFYNDVVDEPVPVPSLEVAEMTKLVENTQRDVNIALMNELASAAEAMGIDIWDVIDGAATKWNFHQYEPGLGVGGHCLPVDPHYLRDAAERNGETLELVRAAREVNASRAEDYIEKIRTTIETVGKSLSSLSVSVLGVTYKPDVKDLRNSSALELIRLLRSEDVDVMVYDPHFEPNEEIDNFGVLNSSSAVEAVRNTDVVVIATGHSPFRRFDPESLMRAMEPNPILIDPQRTFDSDAVANSELIRPVDVIRDPEREHTRGTTPNKMADETEGTNAQ